MKAVDHRPSGVAFDLGRLRVLEHVEKSGAESAEEKRQGEQPESRRERRRDQSRGHRDSSDSNPPRRAAAQHEARHDGAGDGAHRVGQERETDLPIAEMQALFQRRHARNQGPGPDAEEEKGRGDREPLAAHAREGY